MEHDAYFIQIETDDGAIGIGGPVEETVAYLVDKQLTPLLLNRDPMAHRVFMGHHASFAGPWQARTRP